MSGEVPNKSRLILDSKIIEYSFILVLCRKASVCQIAIDMAPLTQTSVIEHLQFVSDDERNNVTAQTLLDQNVGLHVLVDNIG